MRWVCRSSRSDLASSRSIASFAPTANASHTSARGEQGRQHDRDDVEQPVTPVLSTVLAALARYDRRSPPPALATGRRVAAAGGQSRVPVLDPRTITPAHCPMALKTVRCSRCDEPAVWNAHVHCGCGEEQHPRCASHRGDLISTTDGPQSQDMRNCRLWRLSQGGDRDRLCSGVDEGMGPAGGHQTAMPDPHLPQPWPPHRDHQMRVW
jgi:hypothetical protein